MRERTYPVSSAVRYRASILRGVRGGKKGRKGERGGGGLGKVAFLKR